MNVAFLFDNDGVLIDSSELHWQAWQLLMKEEPAFSMTHAEFVHGFGKRNDLILKDSASSLPQERHKELAERKEALFRVCARGKVELLSGMEGFLQEVKRADIPRIIASSTPPENLDMFISSTVLGEYFTHYVSAESVPHGKPAPDVFVEAAHQLGFKPSDCIVFEDAPAGIAAGKAAGAFVVAMATTHNQLEGYDMLYRGPSDLDLREILEAFTLWQKG